MTGTPTSSSTTSTVWREVPNELLQQWYEVFAASREGVDVPGQCPVCGACQLHRYYHATRPLERVLAGERFVAEGAAWHWCSQCRAFEHSSSLVPAWWSHDLDVDERALTSVPDALEDALRRRAQRATRARVFVVEFRSFDGEREKVRARLVLGRDGAVVTVAPTEHYRKVVDQDVEQGVPSPDGYVKRGDGLAFLELLAPNFRGSTYYATKVLEMDEQEAMTPPPYEPPTKR